MKTRTKLFFWFLLTLPFFWVLYLTFTDGLGAQPAEELNKKLGNITVILLLANLYWGCFNVLINNKLLRPYTALRRPLGVATFIYACFHLASYYAREGDFSVAFDQMIHKTYLIFGLSSIALLLLLAITSNNFSIRKLGGKNWKFIHRSVFVAFILITVHVLSIEKKSWLANKWTIFPMLAVLFLRFCHYLFIRFKPKKAAVLTP